MDEACSTYGGMRNVYRILVEKPDGKRNHLEDLGTDDRILLKCVLNQYNVRVWSGFIWLRMESVAGSFDRGNRRGISRVAE
jgi:hypothetical protein